MECLLFLYDQMTAIAEEGLYSVEAGAADASIPALLKLDHHDLKILLLKHSVWGGR